MTPRTANVRVAHATGCPNQSRSALDSTGKGSGCSCKPKYFVTHRDSTGRQVKSARFDTLRQAKDERDRRQHEINQGNVEEISAKSLTFSEWADRWLERIRPSKSKATVRAYTNTVDLAKEVFGNRRLRAVGIDELSDFQAKVRKQGATDATIGKHLRHLSICFEAARYERPPLLLTNPVAALRKSGAAITAGKSRPTYFSDKELQKLWKVLGEGWPKIYSAFCKTAVTTGLRIGELSAARWGDLDLEVQELHVRRAYSVEDGYKSPKAGKQRTVHLTPAAVQVLKAWRSEVGIRPADGLIFPNRDGGPIQPSNIANRVVGPAMTTAGIPKLGDEGRARSFHSFRHCYARTMLERGEPLDLVCAELGHSSISVTVDVYGHWSKHAVKRRISEIPASAFAI